MPPLIHIEFLSHSTNSLQPRECWGGHVFWKIFAEAEKEACEYAKRGLLIIDNEGLKLTEQGIDISNSIMSLFV